MTTETAGAARADDHDAGGTAAAGPGTPVRAGRRQWLGLAVLALPTLVLGLDLTVLHLAVAPLSGDLGPSSTQLLWITDVYSFMIAGLLVTMGTLGDRIGRRRLLTIGAVAFAAASLLAARAGSAEALIATRALLGVAGATLMPSTLSLISNMFRDPAQRAVAVAAWMTSFMLGSAIGPLVGGRLLESYWWGSVFLPAVPVMLLLAVVAPRLLPEFRDPTAGRLDPLSVALSLAAILPAVYGIKELAGHGLAVLPAVLVAVGLAVGVVFVRRQRRLTDPLLDLGLFRVPSFGLTLGAQSLTLFVAAGTQFLVLQYLQLVLGLSPWEAGLWTLPPMLAGGTASLLAPTLAARFPRRHLLAGGLVLAAVGLAVIASARVDSPVGVVVAGFTILSVALNPIAALTYDMLLGSAPPERAGAASGMAETSTELGVSFGVALTGSVATAVYRNRLDGAQPGGLPDDVVADAGETLGGAVAAVDGLPGGAAAELLAVAREGFTAGMTTAAALAALLVVGLAAVLWRRLRPEAEAEPVPAVGHTP